ncbi:MAG: hypothetical protein J2P18_22260, partial [Nocardia sp.]|nr:hypothetical protein [Nocardia sp.]
MPLRSEVDRWNLPALKDWAAAVHTGNEKMLEQIDKARQYFADVGRDWHGAASTAAYDRIGQDHDEARKIYADVDDFLAKFNPAVDNLSSHRDVLRAKVGDAEWAQVTVDDKFACSGPKREDVQSHQDLIDQAYREFVQAEGQLEQLLADRGELVRAAGDLFGSSTEVDEAPTQGGRLGAEDGKRLADAARSRDKNAMDALAGDLPPFYLSPADQQSLADGKQVATIPADVQDYYREFFKASGKDGLLALSDHLAESEKLENAGGSITHPAAMQRDNLANAVMMTSNENVGSTGPDGKFRPGGFTALPDYMQHLVSDRVEVNKPNSAIELRNRFDDQSKFARLLGEASPGFVPGQAMSSQMAATAASMAGYVDGKTPGHEDLINNLKQVGLDTRADDSFFDRDKPKIDDAAKTYLDLATRNHATDVSLLSNPTETVLAKGDYYGDPKTFRNEIFNHDWHDQGKVASQLYSWAGDHAHAQTPDGDLSRKALAALPQVFAPTDHDHPNQLARSGSNTEFQNNADLFKKNPELATGLSKVLSGN